MMETGGGYTTRGRATNTTTTPSDNAPKEQHGTNDTNEPPTPHSTTTRMHNNTMVGQDGTKQPTGDETTPRTLDEMRGHTRTTSVGQDENTTTPGTAKMTAVNMRLATATVGHMTGGMDSTQEACTDTQFDSATRRTVHETMVQADAATTTHTPHCTSTEAITAPKGTSYASLPITTTTTATPRRHHPEPPLLVDTVMAQAVDTLQISHDNTSNNSPKLPPTKSPAWTVVATAPKKAPTSTPGNSHEFGLAFERTTKGNNWSTADLLLILHTIQNHDPKAMLSSSDNKTRPTLVTAILHKAQKDIPWFTKFTAMKTMTWGKPSDGTTKIVFSFWLTSTIIKKDLAQLRMDSDFTEMLKGTNTYMKVTKLLEPHSKIVGYFLGKDIIHTNRDDITNRLAAHITKYSQTIWTPALDVLNTTVLGKGHNTRMVTLVVGNSDYQGVLDILTQQPMETLSFLDHRTKRQDINQFDKMLKYHDYIVSHSTAVRLEKVTSLDTQALWEHLQPIIDTTYCDISDGRIQGTTYIQCFKEKEPDVTAAIQSYLLMKFSDSEDRPIIGARGGGTVNSSSTGTRTYRGNPSGKSTGKETTATLNQKSQKDFAAFLKNCPTIDVPSTLPKRPPRGNNRPMTGWSPTARSYKDILASAPPGDNSPDSSITMQSQKTEPTGNKSSNRSRKSLESENAELRHQLNHMQRAQTAMQDTQNNLLAQIAAMSAAIQELMKQQGLATGTSTTITSPPRKLSKHNRAKAPRSTNTNNTLPATTMAPSEVPTGDKDSLMADTGSESGLTPLPPTANPPTVSHPGGCRVE